MIQSVLLAFAFFSRIPVPSVDFNETNGRHVMAMLPLVGVAIGLVVVLWGVLCAHLELGPFLRGAGFVLLPLALSGGIHMDGFCDTVDALASHGDVDTKQRILRDPHTGSFAVVALGAYFLLFVALAAELDFSGGHLVCFALAFVLSRIMAALAILCFPGAASSSLGKHFQSAASHTSRTLLFLGLGVTGLGMIGLGGLPGLAAVGLPLLLLGRWKGIAQRQFGGMSGDLAGYLIQMCELASLAAMVVVIKLFG